MAVFIVDTLVDGNNGVAGGAGVSWRAAIAAANASAGADTIVFDDSLDGGTVTLTLSEIAITDAVLINGDNDASTSGDQIAVSGNNASRIFNVCTDGVTL